MLSIELLKTSMEYSQNGIFIANKNQDGQYAFLYANSKLLDICGPNEYQTIQEFLQGHIHPDESEETKKLLYDALNNQIDHELCLCLISHDGKTLHMQFRWHYHYDDNEQAFFIGHMKDVSQEEYTKNVMEKVNYLFREMSKRLEYVNETDQLTKLKNRGHLCTRGEFLLGAAKREKLRVHAIMIDIDNFKALNAQGGSGLGDECLIMIADLLTRYFCRATDIAIRMTDDDFIVICVEDDDRKVLERINNFKKDLADTLIRDKKGQTYNVSVSVGIHSVTPEKTTTLDDMIDQASKLVFSQEPKSKLALSNTIRNLHKLSH